MVKLFEKSDWAKIVDPVEVGIQKRDLSVFDRGIGVTVEDDGVVLGCGGVILHNDELGELWLKLSRGTKAITAMTGIYAGLKILRNSFEGVTLFCRVKDGFDKGERLARRLGFKRDRLEDNYWIYTWQTQ